MSEQFIGVDIGINNDAAIVIIAYFENGVIHIEDYVTGEYWDTPSFIIIGGLVLDKYKCRN